MSNAARGEPSADPPGRDADEELALFVEFATTRRRAVRNQLVERHMGLAAHVASRFGRRGPSDDDLRQVAFLALVKAVDRFDPERGVAFSTFAGRTIEGEIKRHFRDHTWTVRVPRSAKELHLQLRKATDELTQRLGRSPTVAQLAGHLGITADEVVEGIAAGSAYTTHSLDAPLGPDGEGPRQLGASDKGFVHVVDIEMIGRMLDQLPEREREIVRLRFYEDLSQSEIAARVGISQMHVSRLLRRSFEAMRRQSQPA
ncbi:MAG: SigB/SigF/SigG family RNA polymerase sigma factor [Actinomycetota bacterium]|nr:SigB/SigF/SigG family RNA polymerase sigma factor [Actinomycetota bacterium]